MESSSESSACEKLQHSEIYVDKWNDPNDGNVLNHENRRGRPKAASISNLMIEGAKSRSAIKCKYCARVFPREKSLQAHLRIHTGERPYTCSYPGCFRAFTQSGQLKTHLRLHTGEKPFVCSRDGCKNRFTHANRHCPNHPEATLIRCHSTILRPKLLNPNYAVKINDWFDNIDEEKKTQNEIMKRKPRKDTNGKKEESENDIKISGRKLRQIINDQKYGNTHCLNTNTNCEEKKDMNLRHNKVCDQKIELPKKRWLREAAQDQALIELNQSRPTVLMRVGKENEDCTQTHFNTDDSSCGWDVQSQEYSIRTKPVKVKDEPQNQATFSSLLGSKNLELGSNGNSLLRIEHYVIPDPKGKHCESDTYVSQDLPEAISFFGDTMELTDCLNLSVASASSMYELSDNLNISAISASELVPSLTKSNLELNNDGFDPLVPNASIVVKKMVYDEADFNFIDENGSRPRGIDHHLAMETIYNSPELDTVSFSETPSTPSKWISNSIKGSTPVGQKFNSAYKKNLHNRFLNQLTAENGSLPDSLDISETKTVNFEVDNGFYMKIIESTSTQTSIKSETGDEILAFPLVRKDVKPLDLSNDYFHL